MEALDSHRTLSSLGEHRCGGRGDSVRAGSEAASAVAGSPARGPAACPAAERRDVLGGQKVRLDQAAWRTIYQAVAMYLGS